RLVLGILMTFPEQKLNAREIKQELAQIDPLVHVKKIKIPILIIHGEHDELIPPEHSRKLYQVANEPKTLMILPKGTHKLHRDPNALKTIQKWIQKQIDAKI
ncbi:MAG: serine aminopeptidase domain-containing protein, partial [Candidatus Helarchaeales archaeon]